MLLNLFYFVQFLFIILVGVSLFYGAANFYIKVSSNNKKPLIMVEIVISLIAIMVILYKATNLEFVTLYTFITLLSFAVINGLLSSIVYYKKEMKLDSVN